MVKSMFAGVAGLKAHQAKMDVIGNNIANVNTWGYKSANMSFKDAMYQSTSSGSSGNTKNGGYGAVNANQVGYGVTTGSIAYDFGTGGMSPSSNGLDCMIDGTGFFLVGPILNNGNIPLDTEDAVKNSGLYLSRVGKFKVDPNGYLVDDGGNYVYGFQNTDYKGDPVFNKNALAPLKLPTNATMEDVTKGKSGSALTNAKAILDKAQTDANTAILAAGTAKQDYMEAKANYDAAATKIAGLNTALNDLKVKMDNAYTAYRNDTSGDTGGLLKTAYDKAKLNYDLKNFDLITEKSLVTLAKPRDTYDDAALAAIKKAYEDKYTAFTSVKPTDSNYDTLKGELKTALEALEKAQNALSVVEEKSLQGILTAQSLNTANFDSKSEAAQTALKSAAAYYKTALEANSKSQGTSSSKPDGVAEFSNYSIKQDGTIVGTTSDNVTALIGKIALGNVPNTGGLEKDSGYYYKIGASAGNVSVNEAGGTKGRILGNYLEMAKVDLSTEMTDMITTQRGFQANSKIITVTDQMLEELVNLKR